MRVRYLGHAAFLLDDGDKSVVLDPYLDISDSPAPDRRWDYPEITGVSADLVLVSHDHGDHNGPDAIGGDPLLIRSRGGRFKTPIGEVVGVMSEHDAEAGSLRGGNVIFVFELGGVRVVHLGDFGQRTLRDEQLAALGTVDLLMVPVGAGSTSTPEEAAEVTKRTGARWVLPMHYKTRYVDFMEPVDTFLELVSSVHTIDSSEFDTSELPDDGAQTILVPAVPSGSYRGQAEKGVDGTEDAAARAPRTVDGYRARAHEIVPAAIFAGMFGTEDDGVGRTDVANRAAFAALGFRPRVLVDVSECALATTVLNDRVELPVLLAPVGVSSLVHPDAELAAARAAGGAGTVMIVSVGSTLSAADVVAAASGPVWFQMYLLKSRYANQRLVEYAEQIGCTAIVVTVDYPGVAAAADDGLNSERTRGTLDALDLPEAKSPLLVNVDPESNWQDIEWLSSLTSLPIVVKGIQTGEDAVLCREHGAAAVVLSNHGGQTLPDPVGTLPRLPEVVEAAHGLEVYVDGGVREGADVLKALALGARAVLIGRAQQWGLAVGGEQGLLGVLQILRRELEMAMMFCGVTDIESADSRLVTRSVRSFAAADAFG